MNIESNGEIIASPQWKFTGWHMVGVLGLFFGTIITVNLVMAYFALTSWSGLVVQNSYVASQKFNGWLVEAQHQKELGWQPSAGFKDGKIWFELKDKNGAPIVLNEVVATLKRPVQEDDDRTVLMYYFGEGRYQVEQALKQGLWTLSVHGSGGREELERPYYYNVEIIAPELKSGN